MKKKIKLFVSNILNLFFKFFKIDNNKIIFQSGRNLIDGSPKAVYSYIKNNNLKYRTVWIVSRKTNIIGLNKRDYYFSNSFFGLYHLITAKYLIRSESIGSILKKRKEQIYIQLWHGHGPLKKMGYDLKNIEKSNEPLEHTLEWDYLLVTDKLDKSMMLTSTGYRGKTFELGAPAIDLIIKNSKDDEFKSNLKKDLKLDENKKIVLYAPTFRDNDLNSNNLDLKIDKLKELNDCIVLVRVHPLIKDKILNNIVFKNKNMIDVSNYPDASDLLAITDILISDYSSIIYEFSVLNRPIIFYAYDLEEYELERGFYIPYDETLPGPIVKSEGELYDSIINIDKVQKKYSEKVIRFNNKYNYNNDGNATKKFVDMMLSNYFK